MDPRQIPNPSPIHGLGCSVWVLGLGLGVNRLGLCFFTRAFRGLGAEEFSTLLDISEPHCEIRGLGFGMLGS